MARYIDADVFEVFGYTSQDGTFDDGVQFVLEKIDEQPTADVVEVVRCKDCKWVRIHKTPIFHKMYKICTLSNAVYESDFFCAFGERKKYAN